MVSPGLTHADIVVVGGGPAGTATALACARAGLAVTLLAPRRRLAAHAPLQSLNPLVRARLRVIGAEAALDGATVATFDTVREGREVRPLGGTGHHVHRGRFDAAMLEVCAAAGVDVVTQAAVSFTDDTLGEVGCVDGRRVRGHWLVDATGRSRRLARFASIAAVRLSSPLTAWTGLRPASHPMSRSTAFHSDRSGWIWHAPAGGSSTWTALGRDAAPPAKLHAASLAGSTMGSDVTWQLSTALSRASMLLVGDAAGSLDPATGQGVLNALTSGIAAARTLVACVAAPEAAPWHLARYEDWFRSGLLDGAETLDAMYRARAISFHAADLTRRAPQNLAFPIGGGGDGAFLC